MAVRSTPQYRSACVPYLPRTIVWLILRASSRTLSTWGRVSIHLSVGSNLRRNRLVDRFRSPSASSNSSVFSRAAVFCDSVAVRPRVRPEAFADCAASLSLLASVLAPFPEFVHAVFHFADAVGDLTFSEDSLRKRDSAEKHAREEDACKVCVCSSFVHPVNDVRSVDVTAYHKARRRPIRVGSTSSQSRRFLCQMQESQSNHDRPSRRDAGGWERSSHFVTTHGKSLTHLPQETSAAAVPHILKLNREAVGIGEVEFRRTAFGTAAVRHAERDVGHERIASLPFLLP